VTVFLVHHADAVGAGDDPQRPLSAVGLSQAARLAERARAAGVKPAAIWHSGKLRARQTAEAFLRVCNPFAEFKMIRGLRPDDPPAWVRDLFAVETRDVMAVGHMPQLHDLLWALRPDAAPFPPHGIVALEREDDGQYVERWRDAT
jgi:phosphohistidine phosphatase